jgi:tetratricopeptide (TPR) repeat protein
MNFARLERMISEGDLSREAFRYLLDCRGECEWLDYKEQLKVSEDAEVCAFARDALAMKNVGGGYILVGVRDKTWEQVGLEAPFPLDSKQLRDQLLRASGVSLDIDVVSHEIAQDVGQRWYALIYVRSSKKRSKRRSPTVVVKDFCANQSFGLRRGEIYVRRGDSTVRVSSSHELEELLDRLESQADDDALNASDHDSPFAIEDGTYHLLDRGFERFVGREDLRERLLSAIRGDPRIWLINVHGPGGVGKSALVNWAAHSLYAARDFEAILQLTAKETILTDTGIRRFSRSLYSLENLLDHLLLLFEENPDRDLDSKRTAVIELLAAWKTLIILDNMETVSDGRILSFVQSLPPTSKARVVLTSRMKSGGWELPIAVTEMTAAETLEFIQLKSSEMKVAFPTDSSTVEKVTRVSGGLPLAVQWIVGQFKQTRRIEQVLEASSSKDSPVLEFSFRNIWALLTTEARTILAIMSIFDGPVTAQQLALATEMQTETIERALSDLVDVTLVNLLQARPDGRPEYSALPITLSFARNELGAMGELEVRARQRVQRFNEQMELQVSEVARFKGEFERYGIDTPNEKRAVILCRQAESAFFARDVDGAQTLFEQAREIAPQSAYVLARTASFELSRNRVGVAMERVLEACRRATKRTGALCYSVKAGILDAQHDKGGRVAALGQALTFDPSDAILRHQYGVALSRAGLEKEAIEEFTRIIKSEEQRTPVRDTLIMALSTRALNWRRIGRDEEARADVERAWELVEANPSLERVSRTLPEREELRTRPRPV